MSDSCADVSEDVPVIYGVLNCMTMDQAVARCGKGSQLPLSLATTGMCMPHMTCALDSRVVSYSNTHGCNEDRTVALVQVAQVRQAVRLARRTFK